MFASGIRVVMKSVFRPLLPVQDCERGINVYSLVAVFILEGNNGLWMKLSGLYPICTLGYYQGRTFRSAQFMCESAFLKLQYMYKRQARDGKSAMYDLLLAINVPTTAGDKDIKQSPLGGYTPFRLYRI